MTMDGKPEITSVPGHLTSYVTPRCWFCETLLCDTEAFIRLPSGIIYGPCCRDIAQDTDWVTCTICPATDGDGEDA